MATSPTRPLKGWGTLLELNFCTDPAVRGNTRALYYRQTEQSNIKLTAVVLPTDSSYRTEVFEGVCWAKVSPPLFPWLGEGGGGRLAGCGYK